MRILIGYDGSESADAALADLRKAGLPRDVKALVVSIGEVLLPPAEIGSDMVQPPLTSRIVTHALGQAAVRAQQSIRETQEFAEEAADRVRSYFPHWDVQAEGVAGAPASELVNKADEFKADLVVVGSRGRSTLGRFILGSVSKKVVTDSCHSVRVARGSLKKNNDSPPKILIGVDGSSEAEKAVREVGMRVWPKGTEVRIVAVDNGTSPARISRVLPMAAEMIKNSNDTALAASRAMIEWAERELRAIGLQVSVVIKKGDPQRVLIEEARAWDADSIFVGSRKCDGTFERFWLGSVSTALVTKAHCSVEVVRSAENGSLG
ncbi:MAG TPA: universal stress protein [Pyrinomonadaceae bacterium]|nr:universal stress protein [Pyrinomonadaceae bacterium]